MRLRRRNDILEAARPGKERVKPNTPVFSSPHNLEIGQDSFLSGTFPSLPVEEHRKLWPPRCSKRSEDIAQGPDSCYHNTPKLHTFPMSISHAAPTPQTPPSGPVTSPGTCTTLPALLLRAVRDRQKSEGNYVRGFSGVEGPRELYIVIRVK